MQVCLGFDEEHCDFNDHVGKKRPLLPVSENDPDYLEHEVTHRHRAYLLHRAGQTKGDKSFRPREWHRVSAKHWLQSVDEQIRQVTTHAGISACVPDFQSWLGQTMHGALGSGLASAWT